MESGAREYIDSSRAVDTTQTDMKQIIGNKSKEAKKFAKVKKLKCESSKTFMPYHPNIEVVN